MTREQRPDESTAAEQQPVEQRHETDSGDIHTAWQAFQLWTGSRDSQLFRRSYLGHFDSRDQFGQRLLQDFGTNERLRQLPEWLQALVRLDGAAFACGIEREGAFHIYDEPGEAGCYVFDGYCLPPSGVAGDGCTLATNGA